MLVDSEILAHQMQLAASTEHVSKKSNWTFLSHVWASTASWLGHKLFWAKFSEAVKSQRSLLTCWSSVGNKYLTHLDMRSERLSRLGVPLNRRAVSTPEGIGQSMKTVISKICIGEKKNPKLVPPADIPSWKRTSPPPLKLLLHNYHHAQLDQEGKPGMFSSKCWSSVCDAYLSTVTAATMMLFATTCYWKSIIDTWDHETLNSFGGGGVFFVFLRG